MIPLIKAEDILNIGLTVTQVFYFVGKKATKGLCRFVKRDSMKTAIATLLSIKGERVNVEDIRLNDFGGLRILTNQGIKNLPHLEVRAFLTRYNQLATTGCNSECKCAEDPDNLWKSFCVHKIAEHLQGVKEKVEAIASIAKVVVAPQSNQSNILVQRRLNEVRFGLNKENLVGFESEEDGDYFFRICQYDKTELGHIIITESGQIRILSAIPGSRKVEVGAVLSAIARLKGLLCPSDPQALKGIWI